MRRFKFIVLGVLVSFLVLPASAQNAPVEYRGERLPPTLAARYEVRLSTLEGQLGHMTGRLEELDHRLEELAARLESLNKDMDSRMKRLEARMNEAERNPVAPYSAAPIATPPVVPLALPPVTGVPANTALPPAPVKVPPETADPNQLILPLGTAREQYDYAFSLLQQANYTRAEQAFLAFLQAHGKDSLAGNAQYWLGETFYVRGNYAESARQFLNGYRNYPKSTKAPDNLLKLGLSMKNLKEMPQACDSFRRLLKEYPDAGDTIVRRAKQEKIRLGCDS